MRRALSITAAALALACAGCGSTATVMLDEGQTWNEKQAAITFSDSLDDTNTNIITVACVDDHDGTYLCHAFTAEGAESKGSVVGDTAKNGGWQ